jgi:peptidoglycan/LPS O-acetylase OafA/YrhL
MSYSIYIWQQLFLAPKWAEGVQFSTGVGLILIVLISALSLKFVELPLTRRAASFQIGLKN